MNTNQSPRAASRGADPAHQRRLRRVRRLARLMDRAFRIPGTGIRIGWDGLIGLVPGAGDVVTAAIAAYIVREAVRLGVPRALAVRMVANVLIDLFGGSVPMIGDVFDVAWKANTRNVELLERWLREEAEEDVI